MRRIIPAVFSVGICFSFAAWAQTNPCDLNQDGKVDNADVQAATNMSLGLSSCTANVAGSGVCNVVVVQRVVNAAMGGVCLTTGSIHSVGLTWMPSTSVNIIGYNVYRSTTAGGPYTRLTSSPILATSYTDSSVQSGQTYFYIAKTVDSTNTESSGSNEASATVPVP
jgi:hypothetical protein